MPLAPCCARFKRFGDRWVAFTGEAGTGPVDVLELVIEAPEFLGMSSPERPLPRAAMVAPQSQSNRVLVVVDEAGGMQLAVCPEPGVSGSLAAIVGELLAASGRFWHQKYQSLAAPFEEFLGMSLTDWIAVRAGEGWSPDKFRSGLERSLGEGKFPVVIVLEELDSTAQETLAYLRNMNLEVRALGYTCRTCNGDEVVRPRSLAGVSAPPEPQPVPVERPPVQPRPQTPPRMQPAPTAVETRTYQDASLPTVSFSSQRTETREYGPFPPSDATDKQKEILNRLVHLDDIRLPRKGFEYYLPATTQKEATATIVLAIDPDRWPFPKPEEVIVVVNTGSEHLGGYLKTAPKEIEEFLGSLPRVDRKEHKGCLLLRAGNVSEAAQLVNEMKALKEVSAGGLG